MLAGGDPSVLNIIVKCLQISYFQMPPEVGNATIVSCDIIERNLFT